MPAILHDGGGGDSDMVVDWLTRQCRGEIRRCGAAGTEKVEMLELTIGALENAGRGKFKW